MNSVSKFLKQNKIYLLFISGVWIGVLSFLVIYGAAPLDPMNINWIGYGYDEWDVQQHYVGWVAFRNGDWRFPLGDANAWGYPAENGVNIAFSDSVPWIAILFKLLSPVIPETFQFLGIYILLCFALQGGAAAMLLSLFLDKTGAILVGTVFFSFSPILMERAFRHTSLASHYLILFALYFYFKYRDTRGGYTWQMFILPAIAVGITPYFLPMVAILILAMCIDKMRFFHDFFKSILYFLGSCACGIAAAYIIGSIGHGYSATRDGYGYYSMNLNALINPSSCGGYKWSQFFPIREQLYGQYDGFNYLGFGIIAFLVLDLLLFLWIIACHPKVKTQLQRVISRNRTILIVCLFLTLFAVSNVVCFDETELFTVSLPQPLLTLCGIFRASSRLFYPVFYLLILAAIVVFFKELLIIDKKQYLVLGIFLFATLQLYDLSSTILQKRTDMTYRAQQAIVLPEELQNLSGYKMVFASDELATWGTRNILYAVYGYGMKTNAWDTNTSPANAGENWSYMKQIQEQLLQGQYSEDTIYVTIDAARYKQWRKIFENAGVIFATWDAKDPRGPYYFMLPQHMSAENK